MWRFLSRRHLACPCRCRFWSREFFLGRHPLSPWERKTLFMLGGSWVLPEHLNQFPFYLRMTKLGLLPDVEKAYVNFWPQLYLGFLRGGQLEAQYFHMQIRVVRDGSTTVQLLDNLSPELQLPLGLKNKGDSSVETMIVLNNCLESVLFRCVSSK